jgi:hypothetical protein
LARCSVAALLRLTDAAKLDSLFGRRRACETEFTSQNHSRTSNNTNIQTYIHTYMHTYIYSLKFTLSLRRWKALLLARCSVAALLRLTDAAKLDSLFGRRRTTVPVKQNSQIKIIHVHETKQTYIRSYIHTYIHTSYMHILSL